MKPEASNHNPSPRYLRGLLDQAGISQRAAAAQIGISERVMRYYLSDNDLREAPYPVQFALECLAGLSGTLEASNHQDKRPWPL